MKTVGAFIVVLLVAGLVFYGLDYVLFGVQDAPLPFGSGGH